MKRCIFCLMLIILLVCVFAPGVSAAGEEISAEVVTEAAGDTGGGDWSEFFGAEMWEIAKEWVLNNLSTVVGGVLAFATLIMGIATKFSFVPKVIVAFKSLFTAVEEWYGSTHDSLQNMSANQQKFNDKISDTVDTMREQSAENIELRRELVELRKKHIQVITEYKGMTAALLETIQLQNDELEDLIQNSPLTKYDLDKHAEVYAKKKAAIAAVQAELSPVGGGDE